MGLFSGGKKYKRYAEAALANARLVQDYQSEQEFRRQMLSNIRQERIARAQLEQGNYSTTARTSSQQGAIANIDSSLAGESYYAYASSDRAQQIQNYNDQAEYWNKKYQKAQKKRAAAGSIVGTAAGVVAGAMTGGFGLGLGALAGGIMGGQIGQGVGQIATGQTQNGVNNMLSGAGFAYNAKVNKSILDSYGVDTNTTLQTPAGYDRYEAISLDNNGRMVFNTAEQYMLARQKAAVVSVLGGY
jgi:hypothetical protein